MQDATATAPAPAHDLSAADSPAVESPDTPVNTHDSAKIIIETDLDSPDRFPDEPVLHYVKHDDPSSRPPHSIPIDTDIVPTAPLKATSPPPPPPPTGDLLEDVPMAEEVASEPTPHVNGDVDMADDAHHPPVNGHAVHSTDLPMTQSPTPTPTSLPDASSSTVIDAIPDRHEQEPPAKRARKFSDANQASAHTAAAPSSASTSPMVIDSKPRASTLSNAQFKYCLSIIRTLKKQKDAAAFRLPVDPDALKIPHYPQIIKQPMDLSTMEHKLASSNPIKPDANIANHRYHNADEFEGDFRLIIRNCEAFNGIDHIISLQGKRLEEVFDKMMRAMPTPELPKPPVVKKLPTPPPPPPPAPIPKKAPRRPSTSVPVIRRNDNEGLGRPKREIHPPPPKDLPYADVPKKQRRVRGSKKNSNEQFRFCGKLLDQLYRKQNQAIVAPFAQPVDPVALHIPDYFNIIKKPMDLSTMRRKLDNNEYLTAEKFRDDFKLMVNNCFKYNGMQSPVSEAGMTLQRLFDEKWRSLPPLRADASDEEDDEEEEEDDTNRAIATMESQIETMRATVAALKSNKSVTVKKEKKEKKREKHPAGPVASSSKVIKKEPKSQPVKKKGKKPTPVADDDVLTFEQKKDLSEAISHLDGSKLERVIAIIHEGVPEIRDSQEEIELEIDLLPPNVLTKLYNFVLRPLRQPPVKRNRAGKGTGTGGLKRKSMDEDVEAEKIRQLEERMRLFEQQANGQSAPAAAAANDSEHSSDSSSDDSSGSDSE